jgi:hypothetical protein
MLMSLACCAQQSTTSFSIDPSFMLTASFRGKSDGDWIQKITRLKVLVLDGKKPADAEQWNKLSYDVRDQRFEDLFSIRKGGDKLQLLSKEGKEGLKEIVLLAGDKQGGLYIRFSGKFTRHDLDQMASSLQEKDEQ